AARSRRPAAGGRLDRAGPAALVAALAAGLQPGRGAGPGPGAAAESAGPSGAAAGPGDGETRRPQPHRAGPGPPRRLPRPPQPRGSRTERVGHLRAPHCVAIGPGGRGATQAEGGPIRPYPVLVAVKVPLPRPLPIVPIRLVPLTVAVKLRPASAWLGRAYDWKV